jgi:hypothetical protein
VPRAFWREAWKSYGRTVLGAYSNGPNPRHVETRPSRQRTSGRGASLASPSRLHRNWAWRNTQLPGVTGGCIVTPVQRATVKVARPDIRRASLNQRRLRGIERHFPRELALPNVIATRRTSRRLPAIDASPDLRTPQPVAPWQEILETTHYPPALPTTAAAARLLLPEEFLSHGGAAKRSPR